MFGYKSRAASFGHVPLDVGDLVAKKLNVKNVNYERSYEI